MSKIIKQRERGSLIVVSGPSGCGKGTVIQEFLKSHKDAWLSVSCTSRDPRPGDVPNESYYFITREEFEEKIEKGEFLEYAEYNKNYYGTPKEHIEERLAKGIDVILEKYPNSPSSKEVIVSGIIISPSISSICLLIVESSQKEFFCFDSSALRYIIAALISLFSSCLANR